MIAAQHDIVITQPDFDRLNELLHSPRYRVTHASLLAGLKEELEKGKVISSLELDPDIVTMRSRIQVRDLRSKAVEIYTLVYPDEADIDEGRLSVFAPLGTALLGARAGQTIEVQAPGGLRRLKVERILYQPEAAGDWHM